MKKKNILNLIKYHADKNEAGFREEAYGIAKYFDKVGDHQLSEYIMSMLSSADTFVPQMDDSVSFFRKVDISNAPLPLPAAVKDDIVGIINAIGHNVGINKFLFVGEPGTGKTMSAGQIARILDRQLYIVEFDEIIDSKLGETSKNVVAMFEEIRNLSNPDKVVILFDEIDIIALDRINSNDVREMGRVTSTMLRELDRLRTEVILIATTNLYKSFDKALSRRFDTVIDFNRYTRDDLAEVGESILTMYLNKFKSANKNMRLFKKILLNADVIPFPGELENLIKTSLAFSNPNDGFEYLKKFFYSIDSNNMNKTIFDLRDDNYTVRDIEILTGKSKTQVSRELRGE